MREFAGPLRASHAPPIGADIEAIDQRTGVSLLHRAVLQQSDPFIAQFLLQVGASTANADVTGSMPLHLAAELEGGTVLVDTLLQGGADVNAIDGSTAAHALRRGHVYVLTGPLGRGEGACSRSRRARTRRQSHRACAGAAGGPL